MTDPCPIKEPHYCLGARCQETGVCDFNRRNSRMAEGEAGEPLTGGQNKRLAPDNNALGPSFSLKATVNE